MLKFTFTVWHDIVISVVKLRKVVWFSYRNIMRTKKDECTKIIKYFYYFFLFCFSIKVVKSHTRLLTLTIRALKVKRNISQQYILSQTVFYQAHKFSFLMNIIQNVFDSPFFFFTQKHFYSQCSISQRSWELLVLFFIENTVKSL